MNFGLTLLPHFTYRVHSFSLNDGALHYRSDHKSHVTAPRYAVSFILSVNIISLNLDLR